VNGWHWRSGMWPRDEVGAGVLVISLSYGIGGPIVTVAMLSLALNLLLTGFFILVVKKLTQTRPMLGMYPQLLQRRQVSS
jgi:amino acid permease